MSDDVKKERQKVVDRIVKILALARNNPNEHEAALAADMVQELLAKNNMTELDLPSGTAVHEVIRDNDFLTYYSGWIKPLLNAVAKLYFCGYFYESFKTEDIKRNGFDVSHARKLYVGSNSLTYLRHNFIGEEHNVVVAKAMGEYLISTMETLVREAQKAVPTAKRAAFKYAFMNACSIRLAHRLAERMKTTSEGTGKTNLPALRSLYQQAQDASDAYIAEELKLKVKKKNSLVRFGSNEGARAGHEAGNRIGLDTQVESNEKKLRITN